MENWFESDDLMGDFEFARLFICALNGWNPYSEEVLKIPYFYWLISFKVDRFKAYREWNELLRPQGELISSIVSPENFNAYQKYMKQKEYNKLTGQPDEIRIGDRTIATSNAYFDPQRGLVDYEGNLIMTKEEYEKRSQLDGVLLSF